MSEQYIKAEIVTPHKSATEVIGKLLGHYAGVAISILIVWWFFAAWFPQLGLTYWQLVLPYFAARAVFGGRLFQPRQLAK